MRGTWVECSPKSPRFNPQHPMNWVWCAPVIPALEARDLELEGPCQLYNEFEISHETLSKANK